MKQAIKQNNRLKIYQIVVQGKQKPPKVINRDLKMSVKKSKDEIIYEIQRLRTMIGDLEKDNTSEKVQEGQVQLNFIHDKVFGI